MILPMFPRFPSCLVKSENMLLLNLKERMKKIVNLNESSLCGRRLKVGWKCNEVRNETYFGTINGLKIQWWGSILVCH